MIANVSFNYYNYWCYPEKAKEFCEVLKKHGIAIEWVDEKVDPDGHKLFKKVCEQNHKLDIMELAKAGVLFQVVSHLSNEDRSDLMVQMASMMKKIEQKEYMSKQQVINFNFEQSHDSWLSKVNEVQVLEDLCTDELRREIEAGWRIIAVCPQKHNRRPDYVMGKCL